MTKKYGPRRDDKNTGPKKDIPNPKQKPITTVDDPENDIFDDEVFDDESFISKPPPDEEDNFEKPW